MQVIRQRPNEWRRRPRHKVRINKHAVLRAIRVGSHKQERCAAHGDSSAHGYVSEVFVAAQFRSGYPVSAAREYSTVWAAVHCGAAMAYNCWVIIFIQWVNHSNGNRANS